MAERPPRGPSHFRQRDVTAAIKAVEATGKEIAGVVVRPDGEIRVIVAREGVASDEANPWDAED